MTNAIHRGKYVGTYKIINRRIWNDKEVKQLTQNLFRILLLTRFQLNIYEFVICD